MFLAYQLGAYYPDLHHPSFASALALVHQRFSTNTFPSWKLAHPYRMVAHNGEINTLRGNVNWMAARQASVTSPLFGKDIKKLWPISYEGQSDTACFDNALEFLVQGGYSLAHAAMMLIPEAWAGNPLMDAKRRAFYEYHACLMEPWDGPAAMAFTDGRQIGATLDRNGFRPARYLVTSDDRTLHAKLVGRDAQADVAILQVSDSNLVAATLADSSAVPVGAAVVAIGSALGTFQNTVTTGIVSGKGREIPVSRTVTLTDLLQTDAAINQGNSGGPLIWAATSEVVGMNTLVDRQNGSEGLGFAISSNTIREIAAQLIARGTQGG